MITIAAKISILDACRSPDYVSVNSLFPSVIINLESIQNSYFWVFLVKFESDFIDWWYSKTKYRVTGIQTQMT